eukprot:3493068-Prymnesium_polylepis.3
MYSSRKSVDSRLSTLRKQGNLQHQSPTAKGWGIARAPRSNHGALLEKDLDRRQQQGELALDHRRGVL